MILDACLFVFISEFLWGRSVAKYYACEYDLKIIIRKANIQDCKWPGCPIRAAIPGVRGLWELTSVDFPTNSSGQIGIHVPANQSSSLIKLYIWEASITTGSGCVFHVLKNYNGSQEWQVQGDSSPCSIHLRIIMTLQCPTTTQPIDTTTSLIQTKVSRLDISDIRMTSSTDDDVIATSLMQSTSPATKEKEDPEAASNSWLYITMSIAYVIVGVVLFVEAWYCWNMYQISLLFPWCKVQLGRATTINADIEHNGADQSVTISLQPNITPVPTKVRARTSTTPTAWIETDSQKNK